jgi:ABC-type Na+ efflux pump permease subunit
MSEVKQPTPDTYPGKTLGIVGLIVSFFASLIGLIISIIAFNQSKAAGYKNTPAKVGIILGIIFLILGIIGVIIGITLGVAGVNSLCDGLDAGTYETTTGEAVTCD